MFKSPQNLPEGKIWNDYIDMVSGDFDLFNRLSHESDIYVLNKLFKEPVS